MLRLFDLQQVLVLHLQQQQKNTDSNCLAQLNIPKKIVARKPACAFPVVALIELFARKITTIVFVRAVTFDQTGVIVFPHQLKNNHFFNKKDIVRITNRAPVTARSLTYFTSIDDAILQTERLTVLIESNRKRIFPAESD